MEVRHNNEEPDIYILTDDSASRNTSNKPNFPAIPDYNGSEKDTDGHNIYSRNKS